MWTKCLQLPFVVIPMSFPETCPLDQHPPGRLVCRKKLHVVAEQHDWANFPGSAVTTQESGSGPSLHERRSLASNNLLVEDLLEHKATSCLA